jgi:hypothetical protein
MVRGMMFGLFLMAGCSHDDRVGDRRGATADSTTRTAAASASRDSARADSGRQRDTAVVREAAVAEDPPCFASHFGLACR